MIEILHERVVELEVRVVYQDKIIADLDEVIRSFAVRVEALQRQVQSLTDRLDDAPEVGPHDDPPPHY